MKFSDSNIEEEELHYVFLSFCTLVSLLHGKKLNVANVFLYFLKSEELKQLFKEKTDVQSDYEAVMVFIKFDPALYKSKYVMKYLNQLNRK